MTEAIMTHLPTLADRVWYALHCIPREIGEAVPSYRELEARNGLPNATFSRAINGTVPNPSPKTLMGLASALNVTAEWLWSGAGKAPTPVVPVPPRKSGMVHRDIPGWAEAVTAALAMPNQSVAPESFEAGAALIVHKPLGFITPEIAVGAAMYAWATATVEERTRFLAEWRRKNASKRPSGSVRSAHLRKSDRPK